MELFSAFLRDRETDVLVLIPNLIAWHGNKQSIASLNDLDTPDCKCPVDVYGCRSLDAFPRPDGLDAHIKLEQGVFFVPCSGWCQLFCGFCPALGSFCLWHNAPPC